MNDNILQNTVFLLPGMLVPLLPLAGFLLLAFFGKMLKHASGWIGSAAILASFVCSLYIFINYNSGNAMEVPLFSWIRFGAISIPLSLIIDPLCIVMLLVVTGVGFLIHLYSIGYMHDDEGFSRFFAYLNLFIFFMLMLVMGSNYLVMFIGWEGVGLCSYLLIGFWFKNDAYNDAAKKAFVMNRIGDLGFLVAMFIMLFQFGSVSFDVVNQQASAMPVGSSVLTAITLLLFIGATGKSAQIPLYTWLPDAMAGPTPVSALIHAATMVTAGIYMVCRSNILFAMSPFTLDVILVTGTVTCLLAAVIGLIQNDIKKILAYSTVSQLGLMFAALGAGAFSSGMFHVVTHAFFKALLFLGAGSVIHALHGEQDIRRMGGLKSYIKITFITFFIGSLAISGIPPFAGFFSKDEILAKAFEHNTAAWVILSISSMMTAFYMFRLVYLTFFNDFRGSEETRAHIHESPAVITIPLIVLCALSIAGGFMGLPPVFSSTHVFANYLAPVFEPSRKFLEEARPADHGTEWVLIAVAVLAAIASIAYARYKYITRKELPEEDSALTGVNKVAANKFYVDEFYNKVIVRPVMMMSDIFLVLIDKLIIDLVVNVTGWFTGLAGRTLRHVQTGNTGFYVFAMVVGMLVLLAVQLFA
jgi:NADH-quinone oxidoreductase subunit L